MEEREMIEITGAAENNLKNIQLRIPKERLVVLTGVSGSGKSSLAFDTIAEESRRQWQETLPLYLRSRMPHHKRPNVEKIQGLTPCVVVDQKQMGANARSTVGTASDIAPLIRMLFSRVGTPSAGGSMAYSFNHPHGMCPVCTGLGQETSLNEDAMFDRDKSINEGAIRFSQFSGGSWQSIYFTNNPYLDPDKKLRDYTPEEWEVLRIGTKEPLIIDHIYKNTGQVSHLPYEGVVTRFNRLYRNRDIAGLKKSVQEEALSLMCRHTCTACGGSGLNPAALASRINGYNIVDYNDMQVSRLIPVLEAIEDPLGASLAQQICVGLQAMVRVGLGYLTLSRRTDTLSGGELQRLKMVRHLGSSLSNITYIFDEPTAGLHPSDVKRICDLLLQLRYHHNTVLVVEHDKQVIALADHIIELGPRAGSGGGKVVFQGTPKELCSAETLTAEVLRERVTLNDTPLPWTESFPVSDANVHNLKNVAVAFPKGVLTAVTGVAGSGKSSLTCCALLDRYPEAILISQAPVGTTSRSTPATYTGAMDEIRKVFARENGVSAQWFSFNSKGGCPVCKGKGEIMPDVAFADPVAITCEECGGRRYNPTALSYTYQDKTIEQVLALTVTEALSFFTQRQICEPLQLLQAVGLGYMTLGQPLSTLSGGEVQRLKLASELTKSGNIYIFDEPTTGLHRNDVQLLLKLLRQLVNQGNTVIVVEHRLEVIAQADWIIDMGPGAGDRGGSVVFTGTPRQLLDCRESETARFLREAVEPAVSAV